MGGRRRRAANPISLFAFQDIITSVTAIMILLVLILTLELITRGRQAGVERDHVRTAAELRAAVTQMERTAADLQKEVAGLQAGADRAASLDEVGLRRAVVAARTGRDRSAAALLAAEAVVAEATRERHDTDRALATASAADDDVARLAREVADLRSRTRAQESANAAERRRLSGEEERRAATTPMLLFNPAAGDERRPRLVEVSDKGVAVAEQGGRSAKQLGWGLLGPPTAFTSWLGGIDRASESIVILVRPSGAPRYDAVREAVVSAGLDVGTELAAEDAPVTLSGGQDAR